MLSFRRVDWRTAKKINPGYAGHPEEERILHALALTIRRSLNISASSLEFSLVLFLLFLRFATFLFLTLIGNIGSRKRIWHRWER